MADISITIGGDGLDKLIRGTGRIHKAGAQEIRRGLISGGRKVTTQVKRAMVAQTGIKPHSISRRTTGYYDAGRNAWIIKGQGKGVKLDEVKGVRAGAYTPRKSKGPGSRADQPRDAQGRFATWPNPRLARGLVTAAVWNSPRRFAYSYRDGGIFRSAMPGKPINQLFGPAVYKELVKDQSAAAFRSGAVLVQGEIRRRLVRLSGGAIS